MSEFPSAIALSSLDGANGFRLAGVAVNDRTGGSVSSAGDVNGDGFDDIIIGAPLADTNGTYSGASYVVFGRAGGFTPNLDLSSLNGTNGFRLEGAIADDISGWSVSSAGDVNHDGFDDMIVGAQASDRNGSESGAAYVVFGKAGGFASSLNLSSLNGSNGFRLDGVAASDHSGFSVSSAGDVNGDGIDDLIVGAPDADQNGSRSGSSYVVFGKADGFASSLNLSSLNGTNGFRLDGAAAGDNSGFSVSSAGDVNGDGFEDLIVGVPDANPNGSGSGSSYVVFGKAGGFASSLNLSSLNGTNGFRLDGVATGDLSGRSVSSAGDVNGDGFDDVIVGAPIAGPNGTSSGASYVVFGKAGGFSSSLNLSSLNGTNGFRLDGAAASDHSGFSVSSAGDVNGDGFDDVIVGAIDAQPNGSDTGASYVVFGKAGGFASSLDLSSLDGTNGFRLDGVATDDITGWSVSSAGDVNGDGFDDLVVGAPRTGQYGIGSSYIIFGRAPDHAVTRSGTNVANTISGGAFADHLNGLGGNDTLRGNAGNDTLDGGTGADLMRGGSGDDVYFVDNTGDRVLEYAGGGNDTIFARTSYVLAAGYQVETLRASSVASTTAMDLTGNEFAQTLYGNAGANVLDGGGGADRMTGYGGNDSYFVDNSGDLVFEASGEGNDTIFARASYALAGGQSVETLRASSVAGTSAIDLTGNSRAQSLYGNAGDNRLDGGGGTDTMWGYGGNDSYFVDDASDRVVEASGQGNDTVFARASYVLQSGQSVETLRASSVNSTTAMNLTGNNLAQTINGNAGNNLIDGKGGSDTLRGYGGSDTFQFSTALTSPISRPPSTRSGSTARSLPRSASARWMPMPSRISASPVRWSMQTIAFSTTTTRASCSTIPTARRRAGVSNSPSSTTSPPISPMRISSSSREAKFAGVGPDAWSDAAVIVLGGPYPKAGSRFPGRATRRSVGACHRHP